MTSKPMIAGASPAEMSERAHRPAHGVERALLIEGTVSAVMLEPAANLLVGAQFSAHRQTEHRRAAMLARALETAIIPRLALACREAAAPVHVADAEEQGPTDDDVAALCRLALNGDLRGAAAVLHGLLNRGVPLERIYLELLAPAARELGELWSADRCDFAAVTMGLYCMQQLVLEHGRFFGPRPGRHSSTERRILLAPTPGEQHSFGLLIVGEFFRRQGWEVCSGTGASARELVAMTRKQSFSMVGLSLACESRIGAMSTLIRDMRKATRDSSLGIMVGGKVFVDRPELAVLVGADATASDGQQAVLKAETLLALLTED